MIGDPRLWLAIAAVIVFFAIAAVPGKQQKEPCAPGEKLTTAYVYVGGNEIVVELCMKNDL